MKIKINILCSLLLANVKGGLLIRFCSLFSFPMDVYQGERTLM